MNIRYIILVAYLGYIAIMSLMTFCLFGKDKKMANGSPKRIKEKTLLGGVSCGGALGGFIGRIIFHHKTNKSYFSLTIYFSLLLQILVGAFLGFVAINGGF